MRRLRNLRSFSCLCLAILSGCNDRGPVPNDNANHAVTTDAAPSAPSKESFPRTITDGLGRRVTLSRWPARIVSLTPANTELLFAVGAGPRVVGVTSYCNHPPEASGREKVGGASSQSLSVERIIALKPDLIFAAGDFQQPTVKELDRLGMSVIAIVADSFDELFGAIRLMGAATGNEAQAGELADSMRGRVAKVAKRIRGIGPQDRVTVFYQVWDEPLMTAGPDSFLGAVIESAGGVNLFADMTSRFPKINEEVLLARNPDVILAPTSHGVPLTLKHFLDKPGWSGIEAVRNGRVHFIDGDLVSRCGPRLVDALEAMAEALYPDRLGIGAKSTADTARDPAPRPSE